MPRLPVSTLFVHEGHIIGYHSRGIYSRFGDSLIILILIGSAIALARGQLSLLDGFYRQVAAMILATIAAACLHYFLASRIAFFRCDSVLAAVVLHGANARIYSVTIALTCAMAIAIALLVPDLLLTTYFLLNFCVSLAAVALLSAAAIGLLGRLSYHKQERLERLVASRHRGAGALTAAAVGGALVFVASCVLDVRYAGAVGAITSLGLGFWYAPLAYPTIEYERLIGHSPIDSVRKRIIEVLPIVGIVTGAAALSFRWQVVGIVLTLFFLLLLYKSFEILTVRAFGAVKARFLMFVILFGLSAAALFVPFSTALLVPACGWWLLAQGNRRTWQL